MAVEMSKYRHCFQRQKRRLLGRLPRHQFHQQEVETRIDHAALEYEVLLWFRNPMVTTGKNVVQVVLETRQCQSCARPLRECVTRSGGPAALPCQPWAASIPGNSREADALHRSVVRRPITKRSSKAPEVPPIATCKFGRRGQARQGTLTPPNPGVKLIGGDSVSISSSCV
jgi:hypothetical protein